MGGDFPGAFHAMGGAGGPGGFGHPMDDSMNFLDVSLSESQGSASQEEDGGSGNADETPAKGSEQFLL